MSRRAQYAFLIVALVICALPVISVVVASTVANAYDCTLHEGFVNPCVIGGTDRGQTLYTLGTLGWLMLVTVPAGTVVLILLAVRILRDLIAWRRG